MTWCWVYWSHWGTITGDGWIIWWFWTIVRGLRCIVWRFTGRVVRRLRSIITWWRSKVIRRFWRRIAITRLRSAIAWLSRFITGFRWVIWGLTWGSITRRWLWWTIRRARRIIRWLLWRWAVIIVVLDGYGWNRSPMSNYFYRLYVLNLSMMNIRSRRVMTASMSFESSIRTLEPKINTQRTMVKL